MNNFDFEIDPGDFLECDPGRERGKYNCKFTYEGGSKKYRIADSIGKAFEIGKVVIESGDGKVTFTAGKIDTFKIAVNDTNTEKAVCSVKSQGNGYTLDCKF